MFDPREPGSGPVSTIPIPADANRASGPAPDQPDPASPPPVPLERLEAQICELAGHLTAATCRFLILLGEFDDRRGWASWDMSSCAAWLSWKCQMSSGTAREHVRVARALRHLPVIRAEFAAARLSYAKVRALTRIATPENEEGLAEISGPMTFYRPDGAPIPASPALPPAAGTIGGCHDADITPDTIIPAWYGERLNLDHAIYVCLANAENKAARLGAAAGWGGPGSARVSSTG